MKLRVISPIHRAIRQISLHLEERVARFGLSPSEGHLISFLLPYGPAPVGELVRVFGHKPSTLTGMLDRLADRGVLRREINPDDRRSFLISLTPEGEELAGAVNRHVEELESEITRRVDESDLSGFDSVLSAIDSATSVEVRPGGVPTSVGVDERR